MVTVARLLVVFLLLALAPRGVLAQGAQEPATIQIGLPVEAYLGASVPMQAVLVDSRGQPIPKATIYFMTSATFLTAKGDMLVAVAVTDQRGQAVAEYVSNLAGALTLRAEFRGDDHYAPAKATAQLSVKGDYQLHNEEAGVQIPGLNAPLAMPVALSLNQPSAGALPLIPNLWSSMSVWPIVLVLLLVWSTYMLVVTMLFGIAASGRRSPGGYNVETGRFE